MDIHILTVIAIVLLVSILLIFFTFFDVLYSLFMPSTEAKPKVKKVQQQKKDQKREKKQRQRDQHKDNVEQDESDAHSEQPSVEEEPQGLSKLHVEFEPEPEVLTFNAEQSSRRASNSDKTNTKPKSKKDKKQVKSGILVNKTEPVAVKTHAAIEEQLNNFEQKPPKDVLELKKQEKSQNNNIIKEDRQAVKKEKTNKKEKHITEKPTTEQAVESAPIVVAKEVKQQEEKTRVGSPKTQQTATKIKQTKKQQKESSANKELLLALNKLSDTDTIGVSLLMNLFRRAELNRSEIQILIDYLLNKQQDMPSTHSEWSDDICQKLKRQLEEKDRALSEQQEASTGLQAKLREIRTEINTERAQLNATVKAYTDKLQSKEQEIAALNQELQTLNEKVTLERQQYQAKLVQAKQAGSQDLLTQLQMMQNELGHKDKNIAELTCMVNASRQAFEELQQKNDLIQQQSQQIIALEQQRDELEETSNNQIFELEKIKTLETENAESKVEICNLQNALESVKADLAQSSKNLEEAKSDLTETLNTKLNEKEVEIQAIQAKNTELAQQLSSKTTEQSLEQSGLEEIVGALKIELAEKVSELKGLSAKNSELSQKLASAGENTQTQQQLVLELHKLIETLKTDVAGKNKRLQDAEQNVLKVSNREKELLQQLSEQKEKNNDLRMKNWKLVEALQNAETTIKDKNTISSANANLVQQQQLLAATTQKPSANSTDSSSKDQKQIRELFQRLYPEAVKASAASALSTPFDQWIEQVLTTHVKQSISKASTTTSNSNKSTQSNSTNSNSNHSNSIHNSHNNNLTNSELGTVNNNNNENDNDNSRINNNSSSSNSSSSGDSAEVQNLHKQNAQLRSQIDELTKLVTKTSNTLSELEGRARETDEHWRSIVRSKEEQILELQHSNGAQDI
ncbi:ribosome-binding protein 1-like [Teleopsis dalmanni]|uniref:ribosome-binding protein 1-like n=1 Tax=Teleopsis dalmanni TaxID=139649 RepID=UPI0018CDAC7E|nr:ribosome-binding protein 1-like [Teleopsis dalmanni]